MAMSLLQQLKCQLKYHKKYVLLQNNNCRTDQIIHLFTCLFIESQNKTVTCGIQQLILYFLYLFFTLIVKVLENKYFNNLFIIGKFTSNLVSF